MKNGNENLSSYASKIDYYREYYSRPEVKRRRKKYQKQYLKNYRYYHNNIEYIMLVRFLNARKRKLQKCKTDYGIYHQKPYSKYQMQNIVNSLEDEVEMYQKYIDSYKEFRKEISGIKDKKAKTELKERFLFDLAKRTGRYR